jgi:HD-like signal output (HDOD) protein
MSYADLVLTLLDNQQIDYAIEQAPNSAILKEDWLERTVPLSSVARLMALQDRDGIVLAFYPASHIVNVDSLCNTLHRELIPMSTQHAFEQLLTDMQSPDFTICNQRGWQVITDDALMQADFIYFEAAGSWNVLRVASEDFGIITPDVLLGCNFAEQDPVHDKTRHAQSNADLAAKLAKLDNVPAMPDIAKKLLAMHNNVNCTVSELAELVESDLSLTAQILRYANSPLFSASHHVHTVKDAIFSVLGYETVLHIALGYSLCPMFNLPTNGVLGQHNFWQHAIYSATVMHRLAYSMPQSKRPKPGMAYLAGLMHDAGILVLNLLFKNEYEWFNRILTQNPEKSVVNVEKRTLGISHSELGAWMLKAWHMPTEVIVTAEHHHDMNYNGPYASYAHLSNLTERLLKTHAMSDADTDDIPDELLQKLSLDEEEVYLIMDEVLQGSSTIRTIADELAV